MSDRIGRGRRVGAFLPVLVVTAAMVASLASPAVAADVRTAGREQAAGGRALPSFGAQFHAMWMDYTDPERIAVLDRLAGAGVRWVRIDMGWSSFFSDCASCLEQWYVDRADMVVDAALARGIRVLVTIWRTPSWANGGRGVYAPPSDPQDFGRFAGWMAEHFRGRVSSWEVWNEPNLPYFWSGDVRDYVGLVRAAYPRIKAADPDSTVLMGSVVNNDTGWLRQAYDEGAGGSFDAISTHPYMGPTDLPPETPDTTGTNIWLMSHARAVHDLMAAQGDGDKPIWFTEFGWSSHPNNGGEENWERGVSQDQQGDYLVRALDYIRDEHPYVTTMIWYAERDRITGNPQVDNYGLLNRDLSPKPVYLRLGAALRGCTLKGTRGNDTLIGTPGPDVICGLGGDDVIDGLGGDDVVMAGPGNDRVFGGSGNDTLVTGAGIDRVDAGPGTDLVVSRDPLGGLDLILGGPALDACVSDPLDTVNDCP